MRHHQVHLYAPASADWPDAHIGQQISLASDCMP